MSLEAESLQVFQDRWTNPLVEAIRREVEAWRRAGYPHVPATSRRLLQHWTDPQATLLRPFFAQVEAVETLIWLREVATRSTRERRELETLARQHNDGIVRLCAKMATGTGKTAVMGMVIAWQTLNAARTTRTRNVMFTNRFAVFAPGRTVRERLAVLRPSHPGNVYKEMGLVPADWQQRLHTAKTRVVNYQAFAQRELIRSPAARRLLGTERGGDVETWEAAVRRVLGDLIGPPGVCVINDEAHHCYLPPPRARSNAGQRQEDGRASVWFNAIRALRDMGALGAVHPRYGQAHPVLDFTATPLWIDTASRAEPEQFQWVASDFGLMDAIESGLVKVPRVPIDDSTLDETAWRRLYDNTATRNLAAYTDNPNTGGLPEHLNGALDAVVSDWKRSLEVWDQGGQPTPPVLIVVANSISNAQALYRHLAGWQRPDGNIISGTVKELSNVDNQGRWRPSPRTLIGALQNRRQRQHHPSGAEEPDRRYVPFSDETDEEGSRRDDPGDAEHGRQGRATGRAGTLRGVSVDAHRRVGRPHCHTCGRFPSVQHPAAMRTGHRTRSAPYLLRRVPRRRTQHGQPRTVRRRPDTA